MTDDQTLRARVLAEAGRAVVGREETIELMLVALLAGGHVLLEGVPGTAKTLMAKTLARMVKADFARVQFTPDLMPSDIVGTSVFDLATSQFHLKKGPIFTSILLADEINRAPPKTQAALLEAMEERQVTLEGASYLLPEPFMVVATQNPVEYEGTYPLPEAQIDRFFFKLTLDHLSAEAEQEILSRYHGGFDANDLDAVGIQPLLDSTAIAALRAAWHQVTVDPTIVRYITTLVRASRDSPDVLLGASPRAGIALLLGIKVLAAIEGRTYALPDDVKRLARPALRHRLLLKPEAELDAVTSDLLVDRLLTAVEVPR